MLTYMDKLLKVLRLKFKYYRYKNSSSASREKEVKVRLEHLLYINSIIFHLFCLLEIGHHISSSVDRVHGRFPGFGDFLQLPFYGFFVKLIQVFHASLPFEVKDTATTSLSADHVSCHAPKYVLLMSFRCIIKK